MRLDRGNHALNTRHDRGKVHFDVDWLEAQLFGFLQIAGQSRRTDQRLRRHAAGIQAIATHLVFFDQGDLGFYGCGDIGADQAPGPRADDHQIAVEMTRLIPTGVHLARFEPGQRLARQDGQQPQQDEGADQARRENSAK